MQNLSEYKSNLGIAHMLVGPAGSGKTSLALSMYKGVYVFVADPNFKSGIDWVRKISKLDNIVGFDTAAVDEAGKPVPLNAQYARLLAKTNETLKNSAVDVILHESVSFISDMMKAQITNASSYDKIKMSGFDHWGTFQLMWKALVMQMRATGKKYILTAHEEKEKDESDQTFKYQIMVDGKIRAQFPALFSDVWRCEVAEVGVGTTAKHVWQVRMLGNQRQDYLKNTFGFPAVLPADEVVKLVNSK